MKKKRDRGVRILSKCKEGVDNTAASKQSSWASVDRTRGLTDRQLASKEGYSQEALNYLLVYSCTDVGFLAHEHASSSFRNLGIIGEGSHPCKLAPPQSQMNLNRLYDRTCTLLLLAKEDLRGPKY